MSLGSLVADYVSDVLVVGAGPSGLVVATQLARTGHQVMVIDRGADPGPGMLVLTPPAQEVLQDLDLDQLAKLPETGRASQLTLLSPHEEVALDPEWNTLLVPRKAALAMLARAAEGHGVILHRECTAAVPLFEGHRVIGVKARTGARKLSFRAQVVIDAGGSGSFLAATFGLLLPRRGPRRSCLEAPLVGSGPSGQILALIDRNWINLVGPDNGWLSAVLVHQETASQEPDLERLLTRTRLGLDYQADRDAAQVQPWPVQPRAVAGDGWVAVGTAAGGGGPGLPGRTSRGLIVAASVALEIDLALRQERAPNPSHVGATVTLIRHAVHLESLLDRALARSADMGLLGVATATERRRRILSSMLQGRWDVPRERLRRIFYLWWLDRRSRAVMRKRGRSRRGPPRQGFAQE